MNAACIDEGQSFKKQRSTAYHSDPRFCLLERCSCLVSLAVVDSSGPEKKQVLSATVCVELGKGRASQVECCLLHRSHQAAPVLFSPQPCSSTSRLHRGMRPGLGPARTCPASRCTQTRSFSLLWKRTCGHRGGKGKPACLGGFQIRRAVDFPSHVSVCSGLRVRVCTGAMARCFFFAFASVSLFWGGWNTKVFQTRDLCLPVRWGKSVPLRNVLVSWRPADLLIVETGSNSCHGGSVAGDVCVRTYLHAYRSTCVFLSVLYIETYSDGFCGWSTLWGFPSSSLRGEQRRVRVKFRVIDHPLRLPSWEGSLE
jgi:hypothetical protein